MAEQFLPARNAPFLFPDYFILEFMPEPSRFGLYGDIWSRALRWAARHNPAFTEPFMIGLSSLAFFAIAPRQRRAIQRNLAVLLPGSSPLINIFRSYRVFWNFAWSIADAAHVRDGQKIITWEIVGDGHFQTIQQQSEGILILTAHMGSYDIAAPVFSHKFHRKLHSVRLPEKNAALQAYMEATRDQQQGDSFQIHYNRPGNMLAIELASALASGDAVAIQGDRVMANVSTVEAPFDAGHNLRLPKGPFVLALASRAPLIPLFIIRLGWRKYQVLIKQAQEPPPDLRDRPAAMQHLMNLWTQTLGQVARKHWKQWFVLEDAFVKSENQHLAAPVSSIEAQRETIAPDRSAPSKTKTFLLSALSTVCYIGATFQFLLRTKSVIAAAALTIPLLYVTMAVNIFVLSGIHCLPLIRKSPPQTFQAWAHCGLMSWILWHWFV